MNRLKKTDRGAVRLRQEVPRRLQHLFGVGGPPADAADATDNRADDADDEDTGAEADTAELGRCDRENTGRGDCGRRQFRRRRFSGGHATI